MVHWFVMTNRDKLSTCLMQGAENDKMFGTVYNDLPKSSLLFMANDRVGAVIYSHELDLFWVNKMVSTKDLPTLKFGLSADGKVVPGTEAVQTTLESYYTLCKRAPKGARAKVNDFYGKKSGK